MIDPEHLITEAAVEDASRLIVPELWKLIDGIKTNDTLHERLRARALNDARKVLESAAASIAFQTVLQLIAEGIEGEYYNNLVVRPWLRKKAEELRKKL